MGFGVQLLSSQLVKSALLLHNFFTQVFESMLFMALPLYKPLLPMNAVLPPSLITDPSGNVTLKVGV